MQSKICDYIYAVLKEEGIRGKKADFLVKKFPSLESFKDADCSSLVFRIGSRKYPIKESELVKIKNAKNSNSSGSRSEFNTKNSMTCIRNIFS